MDLTKQDPVVVQTAIFIAAVCHNANKAICEVFGDTSQKLW